MLMSMRYTNLRFIIIIIIIIIVTSAICKHNILLVYNLLSKTRALSLLLQLLV